MQTYPLCKDIVEQSLLKTFIAVNQFTDSKLNSNGIYSKTKMSKSLYACQDKINLH